MSWSFLKNKKPESKEIYFIEDIYDELEKRTGKKREVLEEVIQTNFTYLKKSLYEKPETILIRFPNLGLLKYNNFLGLLSLKGEADTKRKDAIRGKLAYLKSLFFDKRYNSLKVFNKPIVYIDMEAIREQAGEKYPKPTRLWSQFYKYWFIVQEEHNKEHARYFKK